MSIKVKGLVEKEVEVNPLEVLKELLRQEKETMTYSYSCKESYDKVDWYIEDAEDVSLYEVYTKKGINCTDEEVLKVRRTRDFNGKFLTYLASLEMSINYLSNEVPSERQP